MTDEQLCNQTIDKLISIEDKIIEIKSITKVLNIWIKENSYELIPVINMLNSKIDDMAKIIGK